MMKKSSLCTCGSNNTYESCCAIAHHSLSKVETAEQLMRSRYTAFTLANGDYLIESHHSSTCPYHEKEEIINWAKSVTWLRLEILNSTNGIKEDNEGLTPEQLKVKMEQA